MVRPDSSRSSKTVFVSNFCEGLRKLNYYFYARCIAAFKTVSLSQNKALRILLVDDDATDRELFSDALQLVAPQHQLIEAGNGEEALRLLRSGTLPDLILLDLNMPVKDGREALVEIRQDPALHSLPVCILSTSSAHFDVERAYKDGANLFLVKPLEYAQLKGLIECLSTLFTRYAVLP